MDTEDKNRLEKLDTLKLTKYYRRLRRLLFWHDARLLLVAVYHDVKDDFCFALGLPTRAQQ